MIQKIITLLNQVDTSNREKCIAILNDHYDQFIKSPGSKFKHQAWEGGYLGHIVEIFSIAEKIYPSLQEIRPLPFTLGDAILVLFLHDLEKPFKYVEPKMHFSNEAEKKQFVQDMVKEYEITLTPEQENALMYVHGEGNDHNSTTRIQGPLGAFVHACDNFSARIWFDYPEH